MIRNTFRRKSRKSRNIKDITNQRFGRLVALYPTAERRRRCVVWHCRCDCGRTKEVSINSLVQGGTRSCGCRKGHRLIDETGKTYGWLTVLEKAPSPPVLAGENKLALWRCRCRCGRERIVKGHDLRRGLVKSCGCRRGRG